MQLEIRFVNKTKKQIKFISAYNADRDSAYSIYADIPTHTHTCSQNSYKKSKLECIHTYNVFEYMTIALARWMKVGTWCNEICHMSHFHISLFNSEDECMYVHPYYTASIQLAVFYVLKNLFVITVSTSVKTSYTLTRYTGKIVADYNRESILQITL